MTETPTLTPRDFDSGAEVKWCPGCGDYAILKQVQHVLAGLGVPREKTVFVSGIGCAGRFPYYMNTYGVHTIHGRSLCFAQGLKMANPSLSIWVIIGDGDGFSIGLNHTLQALRRNCDLNILLFNNQIYGLTKGQFSPTSEQGKKTVSTPDGSLEQPINPLALAMAAGGTFLARSIDRNTKHLRSTLHSAAEHRGSSLVEIYQECNIFNIGAFDAFLGEGSEHALFVEHGQEMVFGAQNRRAIYLDGLTPYVDHYATGSDQTVLSHDQHDRQKAQLLIHQFSQEPLPRPFGVLYQKVSPCYEDLLHAQIQTEQQSRPADLQTLLYGQNHS